MSETRRGRKFSEEHRKKLAESHKNPSKKTRQKMSKAGKEKFAKMTKEEKLKYLESWIRAPQVANPSSIEKKIWEVLDKLNIDYKIQVSLDSHRFVIDVYIPTQKLIIECNGDYWHNYKIFPEKEKRDKALKEYASKNGYKLIELWESDIRKNPELAFIKGLNEIKRRN